MAPFRGKQLAIAALAGAAVLLGLTAGVARAGYWIQVSCVNPNGSAASSEGWTTFSTGTPSPGSNADDTCGPGQQMYGILSDQFGGAPPGSSEGLLYTPPAGSTIYGGTLDVGLSALGYASDLTNEGVAYVLEPGLSYNSANIVTDCAKIYGTCPDSGGSVRIGTITLPTDRGGDLILQAVCSGANGATTPCDRGGGYGGWATVGVAWAHILLANHASPGATGFSGSALQPGIGGVAHLVFTATDPTGPGVYRITATIDGQPAYSGTPDTNGGECVAAGADPATGALMFDNQQPCLQTENVDIPIPTAGLPDGSHQLAVAVTNAAQNTSTVLDQMISTYNPQFTPVAHGRRAVRAQFVISWSWNGAVTVLRSVLVHHLPPGASISVRCRGRGCPRLRPHSASGHRIARLLRAISGRRYRAGERLQVTVSAPGRRPERVQLAIRNGRIPQASLLRR